MVGPGHFKGGGMFSKKELEITKKYCERKIEDILLEKQDFMDEDLRDLETLFTLKNAAEQKEGF